MKQSKPQKGQALVRRCLALLLAALTFFGFFFLSAADTAALETLTPKEFALALMRQELAGWQNADSRLSFLTALTIHDSAMLMSSRTAISALSSGTVPEGGEGENQEGTTIIDPDDSAADTPAAPSGGADNGVAAKTIHPTNPAGYLVWKDVYITNTTDYTLDLDALMSTRPAAVFTDELPQILILHTHGTEAYTMPKGEEYNATGETRTTDTEYNVVRVGDEIADVFEEAGISVLHDRTLYDADGYNDAYSRAETAIQAYLQKYPSIHFVLDIHRDAIEDSAGNTYKVISQAGGETAAQLTIVVGSDGSGLPHEHWQENLKLAILLQQHLLEQYPTLMRPMYLRNSRYNEHATTGSLLIEVGAAGNSLEEALAAARLFAEGAVEVFQTLYPEGSS